MKETEKIIRALQNAQCRILDPDCEEIQLLKKSIKSHQDYIVEIDELEKYKQAVEQINRLYAETKNHFLFRPEYFTKRVIEIIGECYK